MIINGCVFMIFHIYVFQSLMNLNIAKINSSSEMKF